MQLPSRFASNSRKVASPSRNQLRKPDDSIDQLLGPSKDPFPPKVKPLSVAVDPVSRASGDEPTNLKRYADDDLVYVVHLRRNKLVIWSFIAVFVAIYVLGLPLRDGSDSQEASGLPRQQLHEVSKDGKAFTSAMQPILPALAVENLAYQVKNWPPSPTFASWSPFVTSMFAHGSLMHLIFNCKCLVCFQDAS
jgi:hypothetical protein